METSNLTCIIIGASQAGVSCAFALREEGWAGQIILFDADPNLPYYRPPLSKSALTGEERMDDHLLKPLSLYQRENIQLKLGVKVESLDPIQKKITLKDGESAQYDKLVFATGSRPFIPPVEGIHTAQNVFVLRTLYDAENIRQLMGKSRDKEVVIIGGGYIGLETAASLKKLGGHVTILEREKRILARVTAPEMSAFFMGLHTENGVDIQLSKNVVAINGNEKHNVLCEDGSSYNADLVIVGAGILVNSELAERAGITVDRGILVDASMRTSNEDIYAIGDCTRHHNPFYQRYVRLESVQNANDQAKIAAAAICGKNAAYDVLPWFWSDQYNTKLQMVGLSEGYNQIIVRKEPGKTDSFSIWYFADKQLLAVDAVNNAKAYMIGAKLIRQKSIVDKMKLADPDVDFKPANLLQEQIG